jgi:hypothetical protein
MLGVELFEVCEQLGRDASARKVMVCDAEGEVLAHAGEAGTLDESAAEAIATLVADVIAGVSTGQFPPAEDLVARLPADRGHALSVCAAPIGTLAALLVIFDERTSIERVRQKMRRARSLLEKSLPTEKGPTAS